MARIYGAVLSCVCDFERLGVFLRDGSELLDVATSNSAFVSFPAFESRLLPQGCVLRLDGA